ncbi:MAG: histidine kinase [Clostridiales bacterium]|nr:histidine kinase [Clostridiales bacterium]
MARPPETMLRKIFRPYAILVCVSMMLLASAAMVYWLHFMNGELLKTQNQLSSNIAQSVVSYFSRINDFSLDLINSKPFRETALVKLPAAYEAQAPMGEQFTQLYLAAYRMFSNGYLVGVKADSGYYIWLGHNFYISRTSPGTKDIYESRSPSGRMAVLRLPENPYLREMIESMPVSGRRAYSGDLGEVVVLARSFNLHQKLNSRQALIEVQVPMKDFDSYMREVAPAPTGMLINIYNEAWEPVYEQKPLDDPKLAIAKGRLDGYALSSKTLMDGSLQAVIFAPQTMPKGIASFISLLSLAAAVLIFVLLILAYRISSKIAKPIEAISAQLQKMDLESGMVDKIDKIETDIAEIDVLAQTIGDLRARLVASAQTIADLESYELQSQLFALQAQTQPHFLRNTLMNMEAVSEASCCFEVADMCKRLAGMLSYISVKSTEGVSLAEELSHLEDYMEIMRTRFPDIKLDVDIPFAMLSLRVPKLLIQPLVENSFKHGDRINIHVKIKGEMQEGRWRISVRDNGKGFGPERLEELKQALEKDASPLPGAQGLGLLNIRARLFLHNKERAFFSISNLTDGGACVELGG